MDTVHGVTDGPLLKIVGLSKSFGGVQALDKVELSVQAGEVYGLIGSNGAGKSTLIKILSGDIARDSGEIYLDGKPLQVANPQEAYKLGLNFIHQELALIPKFTILQNLTLGIKKASRFGFIDWRGVRRSVASVVERVGIRHPLDTIVENLSVADQWLVSIAHALMHKCRIISMDEPTASLSAEESEALFSVIQDLTRQGVAVLYVSHRLDEILRLCRGVSVFKDGKCVLVTNTEKATKQTLIEAIVGGEMRDVAVTAPVGLSDHPVVFEARNLGWRGKVRDVSFAFLRAAIDPNDMRMLTDLATAGRLTLVDGAVRDILPGVSLEPVFDSHTYGHQVVTIRKGPDSPESWVFTGDACYSFENFGGEGGQGPYLPVGFGVGSITGMVTALSRIRELANGRLENLIITHDSDMWRLFPSERKDGVFHIAEIQLAPGASSRLQTDPSSL